MRFKRKWCAELHLKYRKWCAYRRIRRRGDTVLGDSSFVMYTDYNKKYKATLMIVSQQMKDDLMKNWEQDVAEIYRNQQIYIINEH